MEKPVIKLELCEGSFRIPTNEAVYQISVASGAPMSATRVVEKIVETESDIPPAVLPQSGDDDYYEVISKDVFNDIGQMAKSLSSSMMSLPAEDRREKRTELDEAGEKIEDAKAKLRDIVNITEKATMDILDQVEKVQGQTGEVKEALSFLKEHPAFQNAVTATDEDEAAPLLGDEIAGVRKMVAALDIPAGASAGPVYTFDVDTVLQTMYELCTNEAVKGHITTARENAEEIFDAADFAADLNRRIAGMSADEDNFLPVPLPELLGAMAANCSDPTTVNLLKNMDKNRAAIFLDNSIPLEANAEEEGGSEESGGEGLEEILSRLDRIEEEARNRAPVAEGNVGVMSHEDQASIFAKIEEAFSKASGINVDTSKITEVLSFQDLSGQQIMKIIKLLSDFQVQLLALVVSFGSRIKGKEENRKLTVEESRKLAQEEVDRYLGDVEEDEEVDDGKLDQETVNKMLEEFGF